MSNAKNILTAKKIFDSNKNSPDYFNWKGNTTGNVGKIVKKELNKRNKKSKKPKTVVDKVAKTIGYTLYLLKEKTRLLSKHLITLGLISGTLLLGASILLSAKDGMDYGDGYDGSGRSSGRTSESMRHKLKNTESLRLEAYWDSLGKKWTIGYGHTGTVDGVVIHPGMKITKEKAEQLFDNDLARFENYVNRVVKVPISQNMFDAMVSYSYNTGHLGPKFLSKLNAGDYRGAQAELETSDKSEGLQKRRAEERALFGKDITADNKLREPMSSPNIVATGRKIGGYQLETDKVKLTDKQVEYLKSLGGSGIVTSGVRDYKKGQRYELSHASGNKLDFAMRGLTKEGIIQKVVPIMRHPATVHVAFEGLGRNHQDSISMSQEIEATIKERYPDIASRINSGDLKIYHWGWTYSHAPHIDVLINPRKIGTTSYNTGNTKTAMNNVKSPTKTNSSSNSKVANKPNIKKSNNRVAYNPNDKAIYNSGVNPLNVLKNSTKSNTSQVV